MSSKRPAQWDVAFGFKQARFGNETASREYRDPHIVNSLPAQGSLHDADARLGGTDFSSWTEAALKEYLDRHGAEYDDCVDVYALAQRAFECEQQTAGTTEQAADDGEDALDAFMADIDQTIAANDRQAKPRDAEPAATRALDCDNEDATDEYIQAHAASKAAKADRSVPDFSGYGSDEEVYAVAKALDVDAASDDDGGGARGKQELAPLPPVQHELIAYPPFTKALYDENPEVFAMDEAEVAQRRAELQIQATGAEVPRPVTSFEHCGFGVKLSDAIHKAGYTEPTAIQAQALPAALSGRDVLGIAKTGSGKTAAFVLPMVVHIGAQARVKEGEGPVAVLLAPTRELAEQIHQQCRLFCKPSGFRCCAAFGGLAKYPQMKELRSGVEVAVATPGRLIDLVRSRACDFLRTTYLVIDEADRCFDLGFEPQVFSLVRHIRPDRQTLLFSATMPRKVQHLANEALSNPIRITVGAPGAANLDVRQAVLVMASYEQKLQWLSAKVQGFVDEGDVLVFCNQKKAVDDLVTSLKAMSIKADGMHGDLDQHSRMAILNGFKAGKSHVLVATDVAARGLDIRSIKTVVNFDAAKEVDTHVHRIGRTGRAGDKDGTAYTLLMPRESRMAGFLVKMLQDAGQEVPKNVLAVAMKDNAFKRGAGGGLGGKSKAVGGRGLGFGSAPSGFVQSSGWSAAATTAQPTSAPTPEAVPPKGGVPSSQPAAGSAPSNGAYFRAASQDCAAAPAPSTAPRGFVASSQFAGGASTSQATIVMPVGSDAAAARNERPAQWMQKRLQQQSGRLGAPRGPQLALPTARPNIDDAVARAVKAAELAAARARQEATGLPSEGPGAFGRGGDASYPPPPLSNAFPPPLRPSMNAVPPPSSMHNPGPQRGPDPGSSVARRPPLSAEEARAVAMAAAARIVSGGGQPAPADGGAAPKPPCATMSAEAARAVAQAAAARLVAQAGAATASGKTQDGQHWAWGKS